MRRYGTDLVWLVGIVAAGCQELPPPKVNPETVFQAAREVIESRYPQSASSAGNGFVLALTPITTDGGSRTRKQIAVDIRQNYTGNFEPVVAVRTLVEADDPITMSQPGTTQNWGTIIRDAGPLGGANDTIGPFGPDGCNAVMYPNPNSKFGDN